MKNKILIVVAVILGFCCENRNNENELVNGPIVTSDDTVIKETRPSQTRVVTEQTERVLVNNNDFF